MTVRWTRLVVPGLVAVAAVALAVVLPGGGEEPVEATRSTVVAAEPGVGDGTLLLGAFTALDGDVDSLGRAVAAGHGAYWDGVTEVAGFGITIDAQNGGLDATTAAAAYDALSDSLIVSSSLGTALVADLARADGIAVVADSGLAAWSTVPGVIPTAGLATPADEIVVGIAAMQESTEIDLSDTARVGLVASDEMLRRECLTGLTTARGLLGIDIGPVEIATVDTGYAAAMAALDGVDLIVFCGTPTDLGAAVLEAAGAGIAPLVLAVAGSYAADLRAALGGGPAGDQAAIERGLLLLGRVHVATALPLWEGDAPGIVAMRAAAERLGVTDPDEGFYLGYTQAATAHAVLEAALLARPPSHAAITAALVAGVTVDLQMGGDPVVIGGPPGASWMPRVSVTLYRPAAEPVFGLEPVALP